jgi:hypothetical protein
VKFSPDVPLYKPRIPNLDQSVLFWSRHIDTDCELRGIREAHGFVGTTGLTLLANPLRSGFNVMGYSAYEGVLPVTVLDIQSVA